MATYFVEADEMEKMIAAEELEAYLADLGTKPHTLYKNLYKFTLNFVTAGVLVDGDCYEGATVTLQSDGAVLETQTTNFFGEFKFDGLEYGEYKAGGRCRRQEVRRHGLDRQRVAEPRFHRTLGS